MLSTQRISAHCDFNSSRQNNSVSSYLRTPITWHRPHSHTAAAAIERHFLPAGPTAANLQQRVCYCRPMPAQTDRQTGGRMDTVPLHRPCRMPCEQYQQRRRLLLSSSNDRRRKNVTFHEQNTARRRRRRQLCVAYIDRWMYSTHGRESALADHTRRQVDRFWRAELALCFTARTDQTPRFCDHLSPIKPIPAPLKLRPYNNNKQICIAP